MVSLKNWTPKNIPFANFGHSVSEPWLRPYGGVVMKNLRLTSLCVGLPLKKGVTLLLWGLAKRGLM